jgi:hypothetical protein
MRKPPTRPLPATHRQLSLSFDTRELEGMTAAGRRIVLALLTRVLLEAARCVGQEHADDER